MGIRNEEGAGRLPRIPVLMLLDRDADLFLAHRCDADGWKGEEAERQPIVFAERRPGGA